MSNETTQPLAGTDQLHRYVFDQLDCRGELVQLNQSLNQVFANHQYPAPVKQLLAELMAATALLTATLKFKGDISVQIQGDGPVAYAVVNGNDQLELRAMARVQGEIEQPQLQAMVGKAHMVFTISPDKGERYQGVVSVEGETIAECIEGYFKQSEQLKTKIWIATDLNEQNNRAGALFLQVLPVNKVQAEEDFTHLATLSATVKDRELLDLDATTLLTRLYHQDNPTVFEPKDITFKCGCSRDKTAAALAGMDHQSLLEQVEQQGPIKVDCQFCLACYSFDTDDINKIHRQH
jgi:molecular chaperone Hsp33